MKPTIDMNDRYFGLSPRITKWKELSAFESQLSESATTIPIAKHLYAEYYKHSDPEYFETGKIYAQELITHFHKDFKNLTFEEIYEDMVYCLHKYGYSFLDYCVYGFVNKTDRCRKTFVPDKLRYHYCDILNADDIEQLMTDKYKCYLSYKPFYKRQIILCTPPNANKFKEFISKSNRFIYKPLSDHSGHGIKLIDFNNIDPMDWFNKQCNESSGILEEIIIQGSELNQLNHNAVNSCRVVTFKIGAEVNIIGIALRMGVGSSFTDNAGAGGIYASVDPQSGIVQSDARDYYNTHFTLHPTTGIKIMGFQLPEWDKALSLINEMALTNNGATLVSWDIAYSAAGWCMLEANDNGGWRILQSNKDKGLKHELYKLMDQYFQNRNR